MAGADAVLGAVMGPVLACDRYQFDRFLFGDLFVVDPSLMLDQGILLLAWNCS